MGDLVLLIFILFSVALLCLLVPDRKLNASLYKAQQFIFDRIDDKKARRDKKSREEGHISTRV